MQNVGWGCKPSPMCGGNHFALLIFMQNAKFLHQRVTYLEASGILLLVINLQDDNKQCLKISAT